MTPNAITARLEITIGLTGAPRSLRTAIELELRAHFGLPEIQAAEKSERLELKIAKTISERLARCEANGVTPTLILLGSTSEYVAGSCFVLSTDAPEVSTIKQQRVHVASILDAIRTLPFSDFERFSARVLRELGAEYSYITPHQGDQGIDFCGKFSMGALHDVAPPFLKLAHDVVILFAGQAKHYPETAVGPDTVRELVGAVSLARSQTFSRKDVDIFGELQVKPFSPLVTLLFTTGTLTRGAVELASEAGIIARSGEQLAVFLADKGVAMKGPQPVFDQTSFTDWLNSTDDETGDAQPSQEDASQGS